MHHESRHRVSVVMCEGHTHDNSAHARIQMQTPWTGACIPRITARYSKRSGHCGGRRITPAINAARNAVNAAANSL